MHVYGHTRTPIVRRAHLRLFCSRRFGWWARRTMGFSSMNKLCHRLCPPYATEIIFAACSACQIFSAVAGICT